MVAAEGDKRVAASTSGGGVALQAGGVAVLAAVAVTAQNVEHGGPLTEETSVAAAT